MMVCNSLHTGATRSHLIGLSGRRRVHIMCFILLHQRSRRDNKGIC